MLVIPKRSEESFTHESVNAVQGKDSSLLRIVQIAVLAWEAPPEELHRYIVSILYISYTVILSLTIH